jgi:hypothetical protein
MQVLELLKICGIETWNSSLDLGIGAENSSSILDWIAQLVRC